MTESSDALIISCLKSEKQQQKGYTMLMERYGKTIYNQIYRFTNSHQDTDDVFQNTLIKVFKGISSFEEKSALYSWIYRIAYNETMSFLKKKSRYSEIQSQFGQQNHTSEISFDAPEPEYIMSVLQDAIKSLPERQRLVFELRYFNGMSYKDISAMLETTVGALKASYHIAVKKIENHITNLKIVDHES